VRERLDKSTRLKRLNLICRRIEMEAERTGNRRIVSVLRVAREAGVSNSLIHNHYPEISERVRVFRGTSAAIKEESELERVLRENSQLRLQVAELRKENVLLASQKATRSFGA